MHDVAAAEQAVRRAYDRALGDVSLWPDAERRSRFARTGFHFAEDSESVRQVLLSALNSIQYRAYAAYSRNNGVVATSDLLLGMYGTLLSSVLRRYQDYDITVVFEQNASMDDLYGRLWTVLTRRVRGIESARAYRGSKAAPVLAITDYVLGVTRLHLAGGAKQYQENRFVGIGRNLAYLVDFDDDRHLGGRKHPIL